MKTKRILLCSILCLTFSTICYGQQERSIKKKQMTEAPILRHSQEGITFVVDEKLPAPQKELKMYEEKDIAFTILNKIHMPKQLHHVVKTSFEGERMGYMNEDNLYKCMLQAYADHRPLVLSPDMVWLIIAQGFSRYVNAHPEELRDKLVYHEGKMDIIVISETDILSPNADWETLLNQFSESISQNTKGEIADMITANFTTTSVAERAASQITLMETVKSYFDYYDFAGGCGFPFITLQGTPDDWQKVLDKARGLSKYGLSAWTQELEPILTEFVNASEGHPNQDFWQDIMRKRRVKNLKLYKYGCGGTGEGTTELDGWILKFFPDEKGKIQKKVQWNTDMPSEMVRVSFTHQYIAPYTGDVIDEVPMELWAGFVGYEEDPKTQAIIPKIGWLARMALEQIEE